MNTGKCRCARGLTGPACDQRLCPSSVDPITKIDTQCSGHGSCDSKTGLCNCFPPFDLLGNCAVERKACPIPVGSDKQCGGPQFGSCRATTGVCSCINNDNKAYMGLACETPICPAAWQNCNPTGLSPPSGKCVGAACVCTAGFSGKTCGLKDCKLGSDGSQCNVKSGKGSCDGGSGICVCLVLNDGSGALDAKTGCSSALCPNSNNAFDCGTRGQCDNGKCVCEDDFQGDGCEDEKPPVGAIVGGVIGAICFVLLCAVGAFFVMRHRAIKKLTNA